MLETDGTHGEKISESQSVIFFTSALTKFKLKSEFKFQIETYQFLFDRILHLFLLNECVMIVCPKLKQISDDFDIICVT